MALFFWANGKVDEVPVDDTLRFWRRKRLVDKLTEEMCGVDVHTFERAEFRKGRRSVFVYIEQGHPGVMPVM